MGCIVPSFLHRVYSRCTRAEDISHHIQFLKTVLEHRAQNMNDIHVKLAEFYAKRKSSNSTGNVVKTEYRTVTSVTFDAVSKIHMLTKQCIFETYKLAGIQCPRIVYTSLPKLGTKVSTKRSVLGKVKSLIARM